MLNFKEINQAALPFLNSLVPQWIPNGSLQGNEWIARNPMRGDKTAGSFSVNINTGVWSDFAAPNTGGNGAISLYAYLFTNGEPKEAAQKIAESINHNSNTPIKTKDKTEKWIPIVPVPLDCKQVINSIFRKIKGEWVEYPIKKFYPFKNENSQLLGYTVLINPTPDSKEVLPLTYCRSDKTSEMKWKQKGFKSPRPLYGLDRLSDKPNAMVLVVEGEKCKDAAETIFKNTNNLTVVTWVGGSKGVKYTDWSPLNNRNVVFWPDSDSQLYAKGHDLEGKMIPKEDQPGMYAVLTIYNMIKTKVAAAKLIDCVDDHKDGWDIADFIESGAKKQDILNFIKKYITDFKTDIDKIIDPEGLAEIKPFQYLGYNNFDGITMYYYLPKGTQKITVLTGPGHTKMNLMTLCSYEYLEREYMSKNGVNCTEAASVMIRNSERVGIYDPTKIRGRGAWFDNNRTVLHLGNRLIVDNKLMSIDEIESRYIYEAMIPIESKDFSVNNVLSANEAEKLLIISKMLSWQNDINANLYAGWIMLAPICGAIDWRPHLWLTGESGTGKTWIQENITAIVLGNTALNASSNTTEPGLRQMLGNDAFPVVFDEIETEDKDSFNRVQKILELARQASSNKNSAIIKGSSGGKAVSYMVRSPFLFSSINPKLVQQADINRISTLKLVKNGGAEGEANFKKIQDMVIETITDEWSSKLRGRAIYMIPTIRKNIAIFSAIMSKILKSKRHGDQIGTLLAGAYALKSDRVINSDIAEKWCNTIDWVMETDITNESDHEKCLAMLFQQLIPVSGYSDKSAVGGLLKKALNKPTGTSSDPEYIKWNDSRTALRKYGITTVKNKIGGFDIALASHHAKLSELLKDTPWHSGYNHVLSRIEGCTKKTAVFDDGLRANAICIPSEGLFDKDDEEDVYEEF